MMKQGGEVSFLALYTCPISVENVKKPLILKKIKVFFI